jgi:hypothetical protein
MNRLIKDPQRIEAVREVLDWAVFTIGLVSLTTAIIATILTQG